MEKYPEGTKAEEVIGDALNNLRDRLISAIVEPDPYLVWRRKQMQDPNPFPCSTDTPDVCSDSEESKPHKVKCIDFPKKR